MSRLFLVRGYDPVTGPVGDYFRAVSASAARALFFAKFNLRPLSVEVER